MARVSGVTDIGALRAQADELEVGEEALALYERILDLDPDDEPAANMVGRSLMALGREEEARAHWEFIVELQPGNEIAKSRLRAMKTTREPVQVTTSLDAKTKRTPSDIVEPALAGDGRVGALRFLTRSIQVIEKIDPSRLSVTERSSVSRFRVFGGHEPAVTPSRGALQVRVHGPAVTPALTAALAAIEGGETVPAKDNALLPESIEMRIPFTAFDDALGELLAGPHREHVVRSVAIGPPPWGHSHNAAVRDYIVKQAQSGG